MEYINTTKTEIFNACLELFAQNGFKSTSVRDISNKIGIKTASIYYHYASKEEILSDIFDFYEKRSLSYYQELYELNLDEIPVEEYPLRMHLYYKPEETMLMFWAGRIVMNEHFWHPRAAELLFGDLFEKYVDCYEKFLSALVKRGLYDGENSRSHAEVLARVSFVFMMQFQHPEMFDARELSERMDSIYTLFFGLIIQKTPLA